MHSILCANKHAASYTPTGLGTHSMNQHMKQITALTSRIKTMALNSGFDLVGVCKPEPPPRLDTYFRWVEEGHHADMDYLARDSARLSRSDPRKILPGCESILVVAKSYLPENSSSLKHDDWSIAAYAAGDDYHYLIRDNLSALASQIQAEVGEELLHREYTDTGPILEKAFAQQAGLGWIGKNGCLINPQLGSYLFLGEILLGLPLTVDEPFTADYCGSCSSCVETCPTSCILPDRTLESQRCISYLTIEHRGVIPPEQHNLIGSWLFGCDQCQDVCPWNQRFSHPTSEPAFQMRGSYSDLKLADILTFDRQKYLETFRRSPIKRARLDGLLRNALILAGNNPQPELLPLVGEYLDRKWSCTLRMHAAWSLEKFPRGEALPLLNRALELEDDAGVRETLLQVLHRLA